MKKFQVIVITCTFLLCSSIALASESQGTIQDGFNLTKICKSTDCSSYGNVNWKPTINVGTTGATLVTVTDTALTGWLWGDEIGWINLQPTGGGITVNPNTGMLSGYAYATIGSWINFSPTNVSGGPVVGVSINSSGQFTGWAYVSGINGGWMKFDCSSASTCITTDWRPIPYRTVTAQSSTDSNSSSGSSSGGSFLGGFTSFIGGLLGHTYTSPIEASTHTSDISNTSDISSSSSINSTKGSTSKNVYPVISDNNKSVPQGGIWQTIIQSSITKISLVAISLVILIFLIRIFL